MSSIPAKRRLRERGCFSRRTTGADVIPVLAWIAPTFSSPWTGRHLPQGDNISSLSSQVDHFFTRALRRALAEAESFFIAYCTCLPLRTRARMTQGVQVLKGKTRPAIGGSVSDFVKLRPRVGVAPRTT
jgi:hypothetical protein